MKFNWYIYDTWVTYNLKYLGKMVYIITQVARFYASTPLTWVKNTA